MPGRAPSTARLLFQASASLMVFCGVCLIMGIALMLVADGIWVAGVALFALVALAGLWLTYA